MDTVGALPDGTEAYWLANGITESKPMMEEPEGLGKFENGTYDDAFQIEAAKAAAKNDGAIAVGLGGTGI